MDKRLGLRQHFQNEASMQMADKQYRDRTVQLNDFENTVVEAFNVLIKFMDGKVTKTEVTNQLKSISTPDVDKVVQAVSKLDKDILSNKLDLKPVIDALNGMKRELGLIPKSHPKAIEQKDSIRVTNLDEVKLDTSDVVSAIKALKLDVKAPIINEKEVNLKPLQDIMLDLLRVAQSQKPVVIPEFPEFPEIPKTDLTKVEKKLDESNKHLKAIIEKPTGGGGGGGGGILSAYDRSGVLRGLTAIESADVPGLYGLLVLNYDGSSLSTGGGGGGAVTTYDWVTEADITMVTEADITLVTEGA